MTTAQIRAECRKYAEKYVDLQRQDFSAWAFSAAGRTRISP